MENVLTARVAQFITETDWRRLPAPIHSVAKGLVYDHLSVTLAGSRSMAGRLIQEYVEGLKGLPEAPILGTDRRAPEALASLANGVAAHADDYDDTQVASLPDRVTGLLTHPTTPVLAAVLAVAATEGAPGRDMLIAYEVGLEVACKMAEAINPDHYKRGFHSTGTLGAFGAFAAAAKLLRLNEKEILLGIGIVASLASGLRGNFGTMTKPLHAGRAAENGIMAARLAQKGFTATPDVLDSRWGFFSILGGGVDRDYLLGHLGNPFQLESPGVSIKPYPCGSLAHPTMDAIRDLVKEQGFGPERVKQVDIGVTQHIRNALRYNRPQTALEAKFSLEFGVTMILLTGKAGIHQYIDEIVMSSQVQRFLDRVHCSIDSQMDALGSDKMHTAIRVHLEDGRSFEKEASIARGYPERPFSMDDHLAKFKECAETVVDKDAGETVWRLLMNLEELPSVNEITKYLVPKT